MTRHKKYYIILSLLIFSLSVTFIDAFIHPPYIVKIMIKMIFFLGIPILFFMIYKNEWKEFKALFKFDRKSIFISVLIGSIIFCIILGGYFLTRSYIDFSGVADSLSSGMGITKENIFSVGMYIAFLNSFLEEFFFRGFGFITLKKYVDRKFAYIFSPVLFAVYHIGMLSLMFHPIVLLFLMAGLIVGGMIFNFLNDYFGNIYTSWFVHMAANFAINTIGLILYGIL